MQSAVETLSPTRVKLTVEVPFDELKADLDKAYKKIASQVKVQGFRPGKVPPRILDQRVGRGVVLEEAVNEALPRLYGEAVEETGVSPVGRPEVDVTEFTDGDKLAFTAEVDVRPEFDLPAFDTVTVTVDAVEVSEADVTEQLDALRARFAKLTPVERAAGDGDFVTIDLAATVDGAEVPGGTAAGMSYEVGSGTLLEGLDDAVRGKQAGDAGTFDTLLVAGDLEGQTAQVAVTVRSVNERELPEATDQWASDTTGFDDLAALTGDIRGRIERMKKLEQGTEARDKVLEALLEKIEVPLPESVLETELSWRTQTTTDQLSRNGLTLEGWLESEGKTQEEWDAEVAEGARTAVKAQLVLDAVADKEELQVTDAELTDQVVRRAARSGMSPDAYAQAIVQSGQLTGLVSEVRRGKALATVMEAATITDTTGAAVDLESLRDDLSPSRDDVEVDEDGRPFHVHDDGAVHYLDEG